MSMENFTPLMTIKKTKTYCGHNWQCYEKTSVFSNGQKQKEGRIIKKNKQNITVPVIKYHSAPVQPDRLWPISTKKILRGKNNPHWQNHNHHWDCSLPLPDQSSAESPWTGRWKAWDKHGISPHKQVKLHNSPRDTMDTDMEHLSNSEMWLEELT